MSPAITPAILPCVVAIYLAHTGETVTLSRRLFSRLTWTDQNAPVEREELTANLIPEDSDADIYKSVWNHVERYLASQCVLR